MNVIIMEKPRGHEQSIRQYELLKWCLRATANDPMREPLHKTIFSDDGYCVSTDGHRIHVVEQVENCFNAYKLPNGLYKVESMTANKIVLAELEGVEYPTYWRVCDGYRPVRGIPSLRCNWDDRDYSAASDYLRHIYRHTFHPFDHNLLLDAFWYGAFMNFERQGTKPSSGLVIAGEDRFAVIMPYEG